MQIQYFYSILFIELVNDNFICRYGKEWSYGKLISEAYDIISVQAQTHHSTVYLVRHKKLDVLRTAKFVRKDTGGYMRILREADFLKILRHSGIPLIYDIAEDKDSICIIEEFISGKSLTEYVAEHRMLTAAQITDFVLQICDILEYLHSQGSKGMVHLDLKPDNILITDTGSVKLIDFDNAVRMGERYATHYGSIGFAAPEQYHRLYQDCRADIYSLGMLILYMDNGHVQCHAESLHHKKFYPIVKKCIHHSIWQRYRSVKQVRQAVYSLQAENELSENIKAQNISLYGTKHGVGLGILLLIVLFFMFGRQNSPKSESTQSNISNESSTYKNDAVYRAGIYESQFVIGENTINLEVALDEEQVKSVKVKNLDESVETMYPLMKSAVKDVSKQLSSGVSIDEVVLSKNSMYTEKLVLDAVKTVLDEQKL